MKKTFEQFYFSQNLLNSIPVKSFNSHFGQRFDGEYSRIAKTLMIAQNQCFEDDGKGTQVSQKYMDALLKEPDDVVYPILGKKYNKG